jgi:Rrf2 family protein
MRYGTRAMLELAQHYGQGRLRMAEIAQAQQLSEKYLEALLSRLRVAGLVSVQRGPHGGYSLARPPKQITLRAIFDVLEGPEPYVPCTVDPSMCNRWVTCTTQSVWARMYEASMQVLEANTLAHLVTQAQDHCEAAITYEI